ncbi:calcium-binding protein [Lentibacter sp.]|uniref:calcium-binding protein n=1 Tax=Lentibacter sp. TaxID=2024994 RepID=UPI003F6C6BE3
MPVTSDINLTQYYYGNSLVNFGGGNAFTNVPYWMNQLIEHTSGDYAVNGGYGFLQQFADRPEPANEWGFSGVDGLWDGDFNAFNEVAFDQIIITPANFIQDVSPTAYYYGTTTSPLTATIDIIADTLTEQPSGEFFIYEGWSDLGLFSEVFPPSDGIMETYYAYNQGDYHDWYVSYVDALAAEFPDASITLIPVAPVLAGLLSADGPLGGIDVTDLFVDSAPHGTETLYFLASLITYQATIGAPAPADFPVPASINSLIVDNFAAIVDFIEIETASFMGGDGLEGPDINTIIGTDDAELIDGTADADSIQANDGDDTINGNAGDDILEGGNGNDRLSGGDDRDILNGGAGDDILKGEVGDDTVSGGAGNDDIIGGAGADVIDGGDGRDFIRGNNGDDLIEGGAGVDTIRAGNGDDTILAGEGRDKLNGNNGDDEIFAGDGNDVMRGDNGDDRLFGEAGDDKMNGGNGNDLLVGSAGQDRLWGDSGADTLEGGAGNDQLWGGAGADVFVFATGHGRDYLYDFEDGVDLFDITGLDFALTNLLLSGSVNETIAAGTSFIFENNSDSIQIYNNTSTAITLSIDDFIYDDVLIVG